MYEGSINTENTGTFVADTVLGTQTSSYLTFFDDPFLYSKENNESYDLPYYLAA
jgi:hypothetical protein